MFSTHQVRTVARRAHALIEGQGQGYTARRGGHSGRYVVGGIITRMYPTGTPTAVLRAGIEGMLEDRRSYLSSTLGCWEDGGAVYLDLGSTFYDLDHAMGVARERGELAIYDAVTDKCISA